MTSGDLNIGLSDKLTEKLSQLFLTSFRTHFSVSRYDAMEPIYQEVFRGPPPPPSMSWKIQTASRARINKRTSHSIPINLLYVAD